MKSIKYLLKFSPLPSPEEREFTDKLNIFSINLLFMNKTVINTEIIFSKKLVELKLCFKFAPS
jgi:hypothetical protein